MYKRYNGTNQRESCKSDIYSIQTPIWKGYIGESTILVASEEGPFVLAQFQRHDVGVRIIGVQDVNNVEGRRASEDYGGAFCTKNEPGSLGGYDLRQTILTLFAIEQVLFSQQFSIQRVAIQ